MPNVELSRKPPLSPFRKIALGSWRTAYDPSVYGTLRVRAEALLEYIRTFREQTGHHLTPTVLVAKAIGLALRACPEANCVLRWNRPYQRRDVDVSVLVLMDDGGRKDLSSAVIRRIDEKGLAEIVTELQARAATIRARQDKELETTRQSMRFVPALLMGPFLRLLAFMTYTLNWDLRRVGVGRDPFGSAVVTSIGSLGLQTGYVPLVPFTRAPIFLAPGEIADEPVVEEGRVVPGKVLHINATFDHRLIDGAHAAELAGALRGALEDPFRAFGRPGTEAEPG